MRPTLTACPSVSPNGREGAVAGESVDDAAREPWPAREPAAVGVEVDLNPVPGSAPGHVGGAGLEGASGHQDQCVSPRDPWPAAVFGGTTRVEEVLVERDGVEEVVLGLGESGLDEGADLGRGVVAQPEPTVAVDAHREGGGVDRVGSVLRAGGGDLCGERVALHVVGAGFEGEVVAGDRALQLRDRRVLRELGHRLVERGRGVPRDGGGLVETDASLSQRGRGRRQLGLTAREQHDRRGLPAGQPGSQCQPVHRRAQSGGLPGPSARTVATKSTSRAWASCRSAAKDATRSQSCSITAWLMLQSYTCSNNPR